MIVATRDEWLQPNVLQGHTHSHNAIYKQNSVAIITHSSPPSFTPPREWRGGEVGGPMCVREWRGGGGTYVHKGMERGRGGPMI